MPPSRAMHEPVRPAFFVERYAVYDEFAAGGMATVHFARLNGAHGFRRTVAVKRLLPHLTRDRDFALMLIDEARLASRVRHHNVVSTLDVVQTADELVLVMEYIHGESLAKLARWSAERAEPVPVAVALAIMIDALRGLDAAHEAKDEQGKALGLVHRDVSPQNVLVGLDGITRIADFGVAKAAGRAHHTRNGAIKGKLAYMAPEQLGGAEVSRASDVFAAAAVLWELLVGERLFAGKNHAETVFKVMSAAIPRPSARRSELSPELDALVLRGLERDPALRYASAREMALSLEGAAPALRPAELASWVERAVGDRLALRTSTLRAIEQSEESETQARTALRERPAQAEPWHSTSQPREGDSGTPHKTPAVSEQREALESHGSRAHGAEGSTAARALMGGVLVALLGLLSAALWTASPRRAPVSSRASADPRAAAAALGASDTSHAAMTRPMSASPAPDLLRSPAHRPFAGDAAVSTEQKTPTEVRAATPADPRRVRPARKQSGAVCDPPYSIDPAGRVLFKVECM